MINALQGRRVLLIGGAGFIGHHLALTLQELGAIVRVVDSLQVNHLAAIAGAPKPLPNRALYLDLLQSRLQLLAEAGVPLDVVDARDETALAAVFESFAPQAVVQLAAVAHANRANRDPRAAFEHSTRTLHHALELARGTAEHFVFFSSSMVYGNFEAAAVDEETPCRPIGIYGALKLAGELAVKAHQQVFGTSYTIVRPSALYGERCVSRRVGQVFIESALMGKELIVHGTGEERLDFTYIRDLVDGVVRCLGHPAARNQTFNLTAGNGRSVNEMLAILRAKLPGVRVRHAAKQALMPERGTLSVEKARSLIGYEPRHQLEIGFAHYIDWYRELFEARGYGAAARAAAAAD